MSNYHVLETSEKDHASRVAFHIAVPVENNAVGINLCTAVSQFLAGTETPTSVPWLEATNPSEYAQLQNGEVYEHSAEVTYNANLTIAGKRDLLDARYSQLATSIPKIIRSKFRFWGLDRNVP
ncbi:MAG: hypothetical protein SVO01_00475 [Thermotogota bacterium]|nr:hypothetical protein [Thermotogota bacterium]